MSSEENSFLQEQSFHALPLVTAPPTRINSKMFDNRNNLRDSIVVNTSLQVLYKHKLSSKICVNPQFQQYLQSDQTNPNTIIVSFIGSKKIGKSFLVDSLLTAQTSRTCRIMSKSSEGLVNSPGIVNKRKNRGNQLVYFDTEGSCSKQVFFWNYLISSVMVLNLGVNDYIEQKNFRDALHYVQSNFDNPQKQMFLPKLIIVRRDWDGEKVNKDFIRDIQSFQLFQSQIKIIDMPYPGSLSVTTKELLDVPIQQLSKNYIQQVKKLFQILSQSKTKSIKQNELSTKILSLALQPLTNQINKNEKVVMSRIWNQIIENLSIAFYNYYLRCYEQQLGNQFIDEQPLCKYVIYKKLWEVKRKVNSRVYNFVDLVEDSIFQKYKEKLQKITSEKEKQIKKINFEKSEEKNKAYANSLLSSSQLDIEQLLKRYNESELDANKSQVLMSVIQKEKILNCFATKRNDDEIEGQIAEIQNQISKMQNQLNKLEANVSQEEKLLNNLEKQVEEKRLQAKRGERQLEQLKNRYNFNSQLEIEFRKHQQEKRRQQQNLKLIEQEYDQLRQEREKQIRQKVQKLQQQQAEEQSKLNQLEKQLKQLEKFKLVSRPPPAKSDPPAKEDKKGGDCCSVM